MKLSGLFKFLLGFILAIALLALGGYAGARYLMTRLTAPPPRPVFANDKQPTSARSSGSQASAKSAQAQPASSLASPQPSLEPGAYQARVVQPIGLILRDAPSRDSGQIGGIEYNSRVIVVEESSDKEWQRVRLENSDREGWVKAGNTERLN